MSSRKAYAFSNPKLQEQFEKGAEMKEMMSTERKTKTGKKNKKQKYEKNAIGAPGFKIDENPNQTEKKHFEDVPKPRSDADSFGWKPREPKDAQQKTNLAASSISGLLSFETHSSNKDTLVVEKSNRPSTVKTKSLMKPETKNMATQSLTPSKINSLEKVYPNGGMPQTLEEDGSLTDLERFSGESTLLSEEARERNNFLQVVILLYKVGLQALRRLFMDIHPTWSNRPTDAKSLEKGVMELKGYESTVFNTGNIDKWDVSLITTVLLYSKKCKDEISKRSGFESAIRSIKDHKNQLISHTGSERISDVDFKKMWPSISNSIKTIGGKTEDIEGMSKGDILEVGKFYRDLFLEEIANRSAIHTKISEIDRKMDILVAERNPDASKPETTPSLKDLSGPKWDEWLRFCDRVRNFDYHQHNYILITDAMSRENLEDFSSLRSVPWKVVLDFDSLSEDEGMYKDFASKGVSSLIKMITPGEIRHWSLTDLPRNIDAKKTQWMFVNGRQSDKSNGGPQELEDWENVSVKEITRFFACFSEPDKIDKNLPIICLVLPLREETLPFIKVTLGRLLENFNEFDLKFVRIKQGDSCTFSNRLLKKIIMHTTDLSPKELRLGMEQLFGNLSEQSYRMPTYQEKLTVKLTQKEYLYLAEYLDVLYDGCENKNEEDKEKHEKLIEEHKISFMSGNWISFLSLYYNHDAKRQISNDVKIHIQRLLEKAPTHANIVEISHLPGSGGSTIARRVMWDLHLSYPCVFAKLEDHKYDVEDDNLFLDDLADRISFVQDKCFTTPVILLDGKHTRIESLSNKLARNLNSTGKKAVLVRCNHNTRKNEHQKASDPSDVHATYFVSAKLEKSSADLKEFQEKYKDYIEGVKQMKSVSSLSRVFHFPLLAMLEEFRSKLHQIVFESFDEMEAMEKEIILVVAFIQKYAAQGTPAPMLYAAFKTVDQGVSSLNHEAITYEDISKIITERLSNLMVVANPTKSIQNRYRRDDHFQVRYTLQHPMIAELVLKKYKMALKRDTMGITRDFLDRPQRIYDDIRFISLMKDLFVLNGCGQGKFSLLFEELKAANPDEAGELFRTAAEKTNDVFVATSAARFFAKLQSPSFSEAKELIKMAFECRNAEDKQKTIFDVNGVILSKELQFKSNHGQIKNLEELQDLAEEAIRSFRKAKTSPPSFPNPLIGEVKTWLICLDWITKNLLDGDSSRTLPFITSHERPFFQACVSHSFKLLDTVDEIVQTAKTLSDPDKTQREANSVRLSLIQVIKPNMKQLPEGRNGSDIIKASTALCSVRFPASTELERKRLQVQYIFSSEKQMENVDKESLEHLMELLREVVEDEKDASFAKHLMKICVLVRGFSLDRGLSVCAIWSNFFKYDPLPYFYEMMIYFLKILDGGVLEYRSKYQGALDNCRDRSRHNCRKTMSTHYLGKTGKSQEMSRLITKTTLFRGEKENKEADLYWKTGSRRKLLQCCGRIRNRRSSSSMKDHLVIELMQGNIELYVARNACIGVPDRDFVPGTKVYFVVSFNLLGPVANGITFNPAEEQ